MVENNDRGRQARRYFIEMERKALAAAGQAVPLSHVETLTASEQQTLSEIVHARSEAAGENQGKALAEIWSRLHRKFRIARYSQLPRTELADAILYVTGMQLRTSAPKMPELLTNEQRQQLSRIVWLLSSRMTRPEPWRHALWKSFRLLTDCPSPQEFQVSHAPTLVAEAMRILPAIAQIVELRDAMEERALRRLFKDRLEVDEVVHEMRAMVEKEEAEQRDEFQNWLTRWGMRELAPLASRALHGPS